MLDRRPVLFSLSLALGLASPTVLVAQDFAGTWFTNRGVLEVKEDGKGWTATYGQGKSLTAKKKGREIAFTATEGRVQLTGKWKVKKGAFRFDGDWKSSNGEGTWLPRSAISAPPSLKTFTINVRLPWPRNSTVHQTGEGQTLSR